MPVKGVTPMNDQNRASDLPDSVIFSRVCEKFATKSGRIRALAAEGWERTKIAKWMDLRYQHVRNVLVEEERRQAPQSHVAKREQANVPSADAMPPPALDVAVPSERLLDLLRQSRAESGDRRNVTVAVNAALLTAATELGVDLGKLLERHLGDMTASEAQARWLSENREALESHDRFVERHGLWSDGLRQF
jgi:antitoxin CcdA